jgi:hypothetical protein
VVRESSRGLVGFLYLWFVLLFSYVLLKLLFQVIVMGYFEWRPTIVLKELLWIPLGQSVVFWIVTRRGRAPHA